MSTNTDKQLTIRIEDREYDITSIEDATCQRISCDTIIEGKCKLYTKDNVGNRYVFYEG